jgi:hypothetical protein
MARPLGPSCACTLLAVALAGCIADPTSLGEPQATETSSESGSSDDPGASGPVVTQGDGSTSTGEGGMTTDGGATTEDGGTTDTGTTDDGGTTGDPLDAAMVIFVNFDGVTITPAASDDATLDQSMIGDNFPQPLEPYGDGPSSRR